MLAVAEIGIWHWTGFLVAVLFFLALDLGVFHRAAHVVKFREAMTWTVIWFVMAMLFAFFIAFNVLEAILPSLVSRIAPARARGAAIGVYNTAQTLGLFFGGLGGGWIASRYGAAAVFGACAALTALWLAACAGMRAPRRFGDVNPGGQPG